MRPIFMSRLPIDRSFNFVELKGIHLDAGPISGGDSQRESDREPFQKLDDSASKWKPLGELGKAERIERLERSDRVDRVVA
jgi:hypothetical protein